MRVSRAVCRIVWEAMLAILLYVAAGFLDWLRGGIMSVQAVGWALRDAPVGG